MLTVLTIIILFWIVSGFLAYKLMINLLVGVAPDIPLSSKEKLKVFCISFLGPWALIAAFFTWAEHKDK